MTVQVCTVDDTKPFEGLFEDWNARETAVGSIDMMVRTAWYAVGLRKFRELAWLIAYGHYIRRMTSSRKVKPVDIDHMVRIWTEAVVGLSTHHSHAEYTAADHQTDDLLSPLLTAPIAQVRAFATKLGTALEADERVPFMVWSGFQRVVLPIMQKSKDGEIIELKKELAGQIAELAERGLDRGELVAAIAGALAWRSPESLERVKTGLEKGGKPRIRGRESCLFLSIDDKDGEELARVVL